MGFKNISIDRLNDSKECSRCGRTKPRDSNYYHVAKRNFDGFHNVCKTCRNESEQDRYFENKKIQQEKISKSNFERGQRIKARKLMVERVKAESERKRKLTE